MKILVTGGAGFIGHNVVAMLHELGHEVIVYDSFANYFPEARDTYLKNLQLRLAQIRDKAKIVRGDTKDAWLLTQTILETRPDVVIHLAAIPVANASNRFSNEALQVNLLGTTNVIDAVRSCDSVARLVYASSSYVYGHFKYEPADEEHPLSPIDVYGATKLSGENLVQGIGKRFGMGYVIVRPSAVYGPTGSNGAVSQLFIESALTGWPLKLHNGGAMRVDFTYVEDIARGFVLATTVSEAAGHVFNITRGEGRSLKEFADILANHVPNIQIEEQPLSEPVPNRGSLSIEKARKILGYEPKYSLEDGIAEYVDFVKAHQA